MSQAESLVLPTTVWFTGLPASGKSSLSKLLAERLELQEIESEIFDGDVVRAEHAERLGFSPDDRHQQASRVTAMALDLAQQGSLAIVALVSPFATDRSAARSAHEAAGVRFIEVYMATPLAICEARDPKGHYAKARSGELQEFTGISSPYDVPRNPELSVDTSVEDLESSVERLMELVTQRPR